MFYQKRSSIFFLFVLAFGLRLALLAALYSHRTFFDPGYVTDQWDQIAQNLIHGRGFSWVPDGSVPTITRAPGYAVVLAALIWITGHNLLLIRILYLAVDALIAVMVYQFSRQLLRDHAAAWMSGLFYAFFLLPAWHAVKLAPDPMFALLLLLQAIVFDKLLNAKEQRRVLTLALWCGVMVGAAILTRKATLVLCPLWCVALVLRRWRWRTTVLAIGSCSLLACLMVAPWLYRNYRVAGAIAPTETLTWFNYWYGDIADREMEHLSTAEFSAAAAEYIGSLDGSGVYLPYALAPAADLARERRFRDLAFRQLREAPGHVAAKTVRNVPRWWYLSETGRMSRITRPLALVVAALFVFGAWVARRRGLLDMRCAVPLLTVLLLNLAYAPLFSIMRYMVPVVPFVALFAGLAIADAGKRLGRPGKR
jgi:4-amino-4-deoxy-L-arabinose transferase-like glycosyltransferase